MSARGMIINPVVGPESITGQSPLNPGSHYIANIVALQPEVIHFFNGLDAGL